jgi:hypothetical protein
MIDPLPPLAYFSYERKGYWYAVLARITPEPAQQQNPVKPGSGLAHVSTYWRQMCAECFWCSGADRYQSASWQGHIKRQSQTEVINQDSSLLACRHFCSLKIAFLTYLPLLCTRCPIYIPLYVFLCISESGIYRKSGLTLLRFGALLTLWV